MFGWLRRLALDFTPLRASRDFRLLFAGQVVSNLGTQAALVALPFQIFVISHSPALVGLLGAFELGPMIVVSLLGGALADRVDRRRQLAVAQLGSAQPTIGADWLLLSFAAPIIGGAALTGGHISVLGTLFAVLLLGLIQNGMVLAKVDPYWVQFVLGALILAAVGLNRWRAVNSGVA